MKTQSPHDRRTSIREEEIAARRRQITSRWTPSERGRRALSRGGPAGRPVGGNRAAVIRLASAPTTSSGKRRRRRVAPEVLLAEPAAAAEAASLRYVSDEDPGIKREPRGSGFGYLDAGGAAIRDAATLERIRSLVIPPAWRDVWVCSHPSGHIQATGRDDRGRKQYIYHPRWRQVRDEAKFSHMALFGAALPKIRRRVSRDMKLPGIPQSQSSRHARAVAGENSHSHWQRRVCTDQWFVRPDDIT